MKKLISFDPDITTRECYQDYLRFVQLKRLSGRSRECYRGRVLGEDLPALPPASVLDFLVHLQNERKLAPATRSTKPSALCAGSTATTSAGLGNLEKDP
jgi:hypothetical protein